MKLVTVKLLEDVEDGTTGDDLWAKGAVLNVDPGTAEVWLKDGVAEAVEDAEPVADSAPEESAPARRRRGATEGATEVPSDPPADPAGGQ